MRTTSSRDNWERLVAAVIKREQIWQLCHQDSITTVDSDFTQRDLSLRSVPSSSSRLPVTKDSVVQDIEVRKNGSGTITQKIFSALLWRKKHKDDYNDLDDYYDLDYDLDDYYDLGKELVGIPEDHFGLMSFSLRELQVATNNFYNKNILGRGGFGKVYKGRLADGSLVAVKRYKELAEVKIVKELDILSIVKHRNVIGPLGLCITENERLIVYPYMANGSVASCLRERRESQPPLRWETRLRIALRVARALDYLHHGCTRGIIHRDVKAANILLDEDFEAVVSDFSLAIFMDNIDDAVRGTIGHIAPEYLSTGKCSLETDVFGYGIFLLELITAQRAFDHARLAKKDDMMLLDWVKNLFEQKKFEIIVDPYLEGNYVDEEVEKLLEIALICTQTDPDGRPTMRMLVYGDRLHEHRCRRTVWTKMNGKMRTTSSRDNWERLVAAVIKREQIWQLCCQDSITAVDSSRDNWERLVAPVIKREQIWQLCHQDSITTVDSDFTERDLSLRSVPSSPSRLLLTKDSAVQDIEVRKNGSGTITHKLFSALLWRKKHKDYDLGKRLVGIPEYHFGLESFSLRELHVATDNFKYRNKIGDDGFVEVYKGRLADGSLVAVKIYKEVKIEEELEILSIVKHRNVVCPLGVCVTEKNRLIVDPYMANGSVASCLRERRESQPPLEWETRLRIALGVARGLDYLHHGCTRGIIHRDVKAANILLDEDFDAFVADFSSAKFVDCYDDDDDWIKGTCGHIAPEYVSTGECSLKSDVYGYGIFLLELITAQRVDDLAYLAFDGDVRLLEWVDWVNKLFEEKEFEILVDRDLEGNFVEEEVEKLFQIVLICIQTDPERRPTMMEIVSMLEYGDGLDEFLPQF